MRGGVELTRGADERVTRGLLREFLEGVGAVWMLAFTRSMIETLFTDPSSHG